MGWTPPPGGIAMCQRDRSGKAELSGARGEGGRVAPQGRTRIGRLAGVLEDGDSGLPEAVAEVGRLLLGRIDELDERIDGLDRELQTSARECEEAARLMTIPGIGPVTAMTIQAFAPPTESFRPIRIRSAMDLTSLGQRPSALLRRDAATLPKGDRLHRPPVLGPARHCYVMRTAPSPSRLLGGAFPEKSSPPSLVRTTSQSKLGFVGTGGGIPPRPGGDGSMSRYRIFVFVAATLSADLWAYACGDETTEPADLQQPTTVMVVPVTATIVEGDTLRLTATASNVYGQAVSGAEFVWASGNTAVAVVDASGLVTGVGAGEVQVTATAAGVTGRAELTVVVPVPTTVAVTPDTVVLTALGHSTQLTAEVRDQAGRAMDGVAVAWSSADTTVAVVDSSGLVTAVGSGAVTVTATAGEAAGEARVNVMQLAGSVTVSPSMDSVALGDTLRLVAEAYDESGHVVAGAEFTWSSSDAPVASVDPSGLVRGAGEGTATITATAGDASGTSEITVVNPDRAALMALYNATDGPNWVDNTNWLTDAPLGEWYGVSTDAAGRVVRIDLAGRYDYEARQYVSHGLRGELPAELANLTNLTSLYLSHNDLSGPIPPRLGGLASLEFLNLAGNGFAGPIPPELGGLASLESLNLGGNGCAGPISPELGGLASLESLSLSGNRFSGSIPPELGGLASLRTLYLSGNGFSGSIPPELGDLANLEWLNLNTNELNGRIPAALGNLANLTDLFLGGGPQGFGGNDLTGPIPPQLGNLSKLRRLWLGNNDLSGPIPKELGNLASLTELSLGGNDLTGQIPPELGDLASLEAMALWRNNLTGPSRRNWGSSLALRVCRLAGTRSTVPSRRNWATSRI